MKNLFKISTFAATLLAGTSVVTAAPLVSVGDSVDVFFNGLAAVRFNSNTFSAPNAQADVALVLGPGVEVNIGRNSAFNARILYREDFYFYNRFTNLDVARANVYLDMSYNSGPLTSSAGFSFVQTQQNNRSAVTGAAAAALSNNLIKRDLYNAYLQGNYNFSPKYWAAAGFDWNQTNFTNNATFGNNFSNNDIYSIPLDLFYRVTPKWSIGPGFRYRYSDTQSPTGANPGSFFNDYFFNVAITGELAPKLEANINLGYQYRDGSRVSGDGNFSMLAGLEYFYSEKLTFLLDFNKDFAVGSQGGSVDGIALGTGVRYDVTPFIDVTGDFDYLYNEYETGPSIGRIDNTYIAGAAVSWTPDPIIRVTLGYNFYYNESNVNGLSYRNHGLNLQATIRY